MTNPSEEQNGAGSQKELATADAAETQMNGNHPHQCAPTTTPSSTVSNDNTSLAEGCDNPSSSGDANQVESLKTLDSDPNGDSALLMKTVASASSLGLPKNDIDEANHTMEEVETEDPEVLDEEENLFVELEKEIEKKEEEEKAHPHAQPKALDAAPRLLQAALKEGQVKNSDSEDESDQEKAVSPEAKIDESNRHYHKRGSHLDFLLSKASEYSNFISQDLDELQAAMAENARKANAKAEKKKRKAEGKGPGSKKLKTSDGAINLETMITNNAAQRITSKPIFVQPPNLAVGCVLKDYQLEGVRWLASLFENGVSGILADGTSRLTFANKRNYFIRRSRSPFTGLCQRRDGSRYVLSL